MMNMRSKLEHLSEIRNQMLPHHTKKTNSSGFEHVASRGWTASPQWVQQIGNLPGSSSRLLEDH